MSTPALAVSALHAGHGGREVLRGIDLELMRGEWFVLLGANGSGKSTLIDACTGSLAPRAGDIRIDGHVVTGDALAAKRAFGLAVGVERLPALLSARECLGVMAAARGLPAVDVDTLALADALGFSPWLDDAVALMSFGTRQKLSVLLALLGDPPLVLLDETLNGLDAASGLALKRHLRERVDAKRCAVLLATHALDVAERWADRAALLHDGRLVADWSRAQLRGLRESAGGLEAELVRVTASGG